MQTPPLALTIAGKGALIINIPHAGTTLIPGLAERMTDEARALPDTDWHLPFLMHFAAFCGATLVAATHSRYVVDLNRDRESRPLYPDDPDPGLCPLLRFDGGPIYLPDVVPDETEVDIRRARYWDPYHDDLAQLVSDTKARCGQVILLDVHSAPRELPTRFDGRLPDISLGTCDGDACSPALRDAVIEVLDRSGCSHGVDVPFAGGYVTQLYGQPKRRLQALQIEIAQDCYLDPDSPESWTPQHPKVQKLAPMLRRLIDLLIGWKD